MAQRMRDAWCLPPPALRGGGTCGPASLVALPAAPAVQHRGGRRRRHVHLGLGRLRAAHAWRPNVRPQGHGPAGQLPACAAQPRCATWPGSLQPLASPPLLALLCGCASALSLPPAAAIGPHIPLLTLIAANSLYCCASFLNLTQ